MSLNIQRLINAVELAAKSSTDYQQELDELLELQRLMEQADPHKDWNDEIEVVSVEAMCELMNMTTYDDYGKLAKKQNGKVSREEYAAEVRHWYPTLTDSNLECGYDIINDLWSDNEAEGSHNADGTYRRCDCYANMSQINLPDSCRERNETDGKEENSVQP